MFVELCQLSRAGRCINDKKELQPDQNTSEVVENIFLVIEMIYT